MVAGFLGLFQGRFARPLAVGTSLMFFQQVTGQPSVLYYASEIFEDAGFAAGQEANGISVLLGVFKLVMTGDARSSEVCHLGSKGTVTDNTRRTLVTICCPLSMVLVISRLAPWEQMSRAH